MIWFVIGMLVLLAGGAAVLFVVLHATSADDSAPFTGDADGTPTGDTAQHAGEQTSAGETVSGSDADDSGGTGTPQQGGGPGDGDGSDADAPKPEGVHESGVIGGEAEGESGVDTGSTPRPA